MHDLCGQGVEIIYFYAGIITERCTNCFYFPGLPHLNQTRGNCHLETLRHYIRMISMPEFHVKQYLIWTTEPGNNALTHNEWEWKGKCGGYTK